MHTNSLVVISEIGTHTDNRVPKMPAGLTSEATSVCTNSCSTHSGLKSKKKCNLENPLYANDNINVFFKNLLTAAKPKKVKTTCSF